MKRNSASKFHKCVQGWVEQATLELTKSPWKVNIDHEYLTDLGKPDVRIRWVHPTKGSFETFIEIQNNLNEKSFKEKIEKWKDYKINYEIISEKKINEKFSIGYDQVKEIISYLVPW